MTAISIQYGDYNLMTDTVYVTDTDVEAAPTRSIQADKLAEADGAIIVKSVYEPKKFTVYGRIITDTIEETDQTWDTLKAALSQPNQAFDIDHAGDTRRFVATAQNVTSARQGKATSMGWSAEFLCPTGVGSDTYATTLLAGTHATTSTSISGITVGGTYKAEPAITVTVNTITGGTNKTLLINNSATLRGISITRSWTAGDVVKIDSLKKTLYVNNAAVEFSGQFPEWAVGVGGIRLVDDFTARDITIEAEYVRRYL